MRFNVPFKLMVLLMYTAWFTFWLLIAVLWPLFLLYRSVICVLAWFFRANPNRDVLLVYNGSSDLSESMSHILPLVKARAVLLDYNERKHWQWWSFPSQLFNCFGPRSIPERFTPGQLPAVIVFKKFQRPKKYLFGERSSDHEGSLARLRRELEKKQTHSV
jgi:hypothetical protein